jgi:hypothetical protein
VGGGPLVGRMRGLVLGAAAALVLVGCELLQLGASPAFETWTAEPTEPDPAFREAAVEQCVQDDLHGPIVDDVAALTASPLLQDQRGPDGAALLWLGDELDVECFVFRTPAGDLSNGAASAGATWTGHDETLMLVGIQRGPPAIVSGLVDPAAAAVEIETGSGRRIRATVGHGRFLAWWPGTESSASVRALAADGTVIAEIEGCCTDEEWHPSGPPDGMGIPPLPRRPLHVPAEPESATISGVELVVEPIGEGVLRVLDDGAGRDLTARIQDVAVGPDGRVWVGMRRRVLQLGVPMALRPADDGPGPLERLRVGADGTLIVESRDGRTGTHDGATWALPPQGEEPVASIVASADGTLWGRARDGVARLHGGAWTVHPASEVFPAAHARDARAFARMGGAASIAATPDGDVWAGAVCCGSLSRFDGASWVESLPVAGALAPDNGTGDGAGGVWNLETGADGTLWAIVPLNEDYALLRFDGSSWSTHTWSETAPVPGSWIDGLAVDAAGRAIIATYDPMTATASIVAFDGRSAITLGRLPVVGRVHGMAVSPDGAVWMTADPGWRPSVTALLVIPAN